MHLRNGGLPQGLAPFLKVKNTTLDFIPFSSAKYPFCVLEMTLDGLRVQECIDTCNSNDFKISVTNI